MQKMLFHFFSVLYHMFFHFPVSDYGTWAAILPVTTLAAYTHCFFPLSSRTCCHAFTVVMLRSTILKSLTETCCMQEICHSASLQVDGRLSS